MVAEAYARRTRGWQRVASSRAARTSGFCALTIGSTACNATLRITYVAIEILSPGLYVLRPIPHRMWRVAASGGSGTPFTRTRQKPTFLSVETWPDYSLKVCSHTPCASKLYADYSTASAASRTSITTAHSIVLRCTLFAPQSGPVNVRKSLGQVTQRIFTRLLRKSWPDYSLYVCGHTPVPANTADLPDDFALL